MKCAFVKCLKVPVVVVFAFAALPAEAADMYIPGGSMKDGPMYDGFPNWAGFYVGVNGGYGWGTKSAITNNATEDGFATDTATNRLAPDGGFGGGQLGYNLQRDRFVFGIEADIQGADIRDKAFSEAVSWNGNVVNDVSAKTALNWFGTLRGRLGYTFGTSLLYATGGLAFGGVRDSLSQSVYSYNAEGGRTDPAPKNTTLTGYVLGGGLETALTPSWSLKTEYQYIDLRSTSLSTTNDLPYGCDVTCTGTDNGNASVKIDHTYHTVRVGLNYKINQVYEPLK
jgi:outer membrane immunogenic protein